jgi:hypothetical protein
MTRTLTVTRRAFGRSPGSELRLRGKWLHDWGYRPGMKVTVRQVAKIGHYNIIALWAHPAPTNQTTKKTK